MAMLSPQRTSAIRIDFAEQIEALKNEFGSHLKILSDKVNGMEQGMKHVINEAQGTFAASEKRLTDLIVQNNERFKEQQETLERANSQFNQNKAQAEVQFESCKTALEGIVSDFKSNQGEVLAARQETKLLNEGIAKLRSDMNTYADYAKDENEKAVLKVRQDLDQWERNFKREMHEAGAAGPGAAGP